MKAYRERLSMTQNELAEKVGVRRETISRLEKGQYNPSLKLALDISSELNATVEELFIFTDSQQSSNGSDLNNEDFEKKISI